MTQSLHNDIGASKMAFTILALDVLNFIRMSCCLASDRWECFVIFNAMWDRGILHIIFSLSISMSMQIQGRSFKIVIFGYRKACD